MVHINMQISLYFIQSKMDKPDFVETLFIWNKIENPPPMEHNIEKNSFKMAGRVVLEI